MDQVRKFLQEMSLTFYADNFEEMGYDDLDHLLGIGPEELLQQLQELTKMRPGHFARFKSRIEEYQSMVTPSTGSRSSPRTPMIILAWAICETESSATYEYFAEQCHVAGLSRYLIGSSINFSDRQKGIRSFHDKFATNIGRCFNHIIGRVYPAQEKPLQWHQLGLFKWPLKQNTNGP